MKPATPITDLCFVQTICYLLEGLITPDTVAIGSPVELYERLFAFAAVWAFGGPLTTGDERNDYRERFNLWWKKEIYQFSPVRVEDCTGQLGPDHPSRPDDFTPWREIVQKYKHDKDIPFAEICVETVDTARLTYLMNMLTDHRRPVMFVGTADKYGTQEATAFLQQHMGHGFWFDRIKPGFPLKEISNCQYLPEACA
eukprot:gene57369-biopygen32012